MRPRRCRINPLLHADTGLFFAALFFFALFVWTELNSGTKATGPDRTYILRCASLLSVCLIAYIGGVLHLQRTGQSLIRPLLFCFLLLYFHLLLSFTLFDAGLRLSADRFAHDGLTPREYYLKWFVNFTPFESIYTVYIRGSIHGSVSARYSLLNLLGNFCAFTPLGFLYPALFKPLRRWYWFLLAILLTVTSVEAMQLLLMVGSCDVDDLILNTAGAMLMLGLLRIPPFRRLADRVSTGTFAIK